MCRVQFSGNNSGSNKRTSFAESAQVTLHKGSIWSNTQRAVSAVMSSSRYQANLSSRSCVPARCVDERWERRPVAWADFEDSDLDWLGRGRPKYFQSSERTKRGFCPKCGCLICAVDNDRTAISVTLACLENPELIVLGKTHSFKSDAPNWRHVSVR